MAFEGNQPREARGDDESSLRWEPEIFKTEHLARKALAFQILLARAPRDVQPDDLAHTIARVSKRQIGTTMGDVKYVAKLPGVRTTVSGGLAVDRSTPIPPELCPPDSGYDWVETRLSVESQRALHLDILAVKRAISSQEDRTAHGAPINDVLADVTRRGLSAGRFEIILRALRDEGFVWSPAEGHLRLT